MKEQIKAGLRLIDSESNNFNNSNEHVFFNKPRADQIDADDWMNIEESQNEKVASISSQNDLNKLLSRFQSFLNQSSDFDGVVTYSSSATNGHGASNQNNYSATKEKNGSGVFVNNSSIEIRPRVFLYILHSVLKNEELEFPFVDPYFYREDYDDLFDVGDDDVCEQNEGLKLKDVMNAMDDELQKRTESRRIPISHRTVNFDRQETVKRSIDEDSHTIQNLIQSMDASGGASGPVENILKGMTDDGYR